MESYKISLEHVPYDIIQQIFGVHEQYLDIIRKYFDTNLTFRESTLIILSDDVDVMQQIKAIIQYMIDAHSDGIKVA